MRPSDLILLIALLSFFAWPGLLALAQYGLTLPNLATERNVRERGRLMVLTSFVVFGLSLPLAIFAGCVIVVNDAHSASQKGEDIPGLVVASLAAQDAILCVLVGAVLFVQGSRLRRLSEDCLAQIARTADVCSRARSILWGSQFIVLLSLSILFPPLFFVTALILFAWLPISLLSASNRYSSQLLLVLSLAVKHGRPLGRELRAYAEGTPARVRARLRRLVEHLDDGCSLGEALGFVPGLLPRWIVSEIVTSEEMGTLEDTLLRLMKRQTDLLVQDHTRASYAGWLSYGAAYGTMALMIVSFLMVFIVPKFKRIFYDFGTELPREMIAMIGVADLIAEYWFLLSPLVAVGGWVLLELMRAELTGGKSLRLPLLHRLYLAMDAPDILRQLAGCIRNRAVLPDALRALGNNHYRASVARVLTQVGFATERGADAFEELKAHRLLSSNDLTFLTTARQAGNLEWALSELAELRERRLAYRQHVLQEVLRPVPVIIGGLIVLFIAVAFFMPIVKLMNDLS